MSWVKKFRFSSACQPRTRTKIIVERRAAITTMAPPVTTSEATRSLTSLRVPESRVITAVMAMLVRNQTTRNQAQPWSGRTFSHSSQVRARAPMRAP